ncbi:hypothetical protein [Salarchaeum japonicum]|uniref:Uncharacterized protein n=1 Tax=Salarchaeum japonicum TaxID=555573 RepID=A0AAV3SXU4_9EURY|nr:hypothetical protein [Salarchaeum japonicum]
MSDSHDADPERAVSLLLVAVGVAVVAYGVVASRIPALVVGVGGSAAGLALFSRTTGTR